MQNANSSKPSSKRTTQSQLAAGLQAKIAKEGQPATKPEPTVTAPAATTAPAAPAATPKKERKPSKPISERFSRKVTKTANRAEKVTNAMRGWAITEAAGEETFHAVTDAVTGLENAIKAMRGAAQLIAGLGAEFNPSPKKGTATKPASRKAIEVGSVVSVNEKYRAEFSQMIPDVNLDRLLVTASTGKRLRVKLSDGSTAFISASQVHISTEAEATEPKTEAATA